MKYKYFLIGLICIILLKCKHKEEANTVVESNIRAVENEHDNVDELDTIFKDINQYQTAIKKIVNKTELLDSLYTYQKSKRDSLLPFKRKACKRLWKLKTEYDSILEPDIDSIKEQLKRKTSVNQKFLKHLINHPIDSTRLTVEKPLSAIFNLRKDSIGIYKNRDCNPSKFKSDQKLLKKMGHFKNSMKKPFFGLFMYEDANQHIPLDSLYVYNKNSRSKVQIGQFGYFEEPCKEYFYYHLVKKENLQEENPYLLASKYKLSLDFGNFKRVDSIINAQYHKSCYDCPSDKDKQKTIARLEGYEHIYITKISQKNPNNDQRNTLYRSLVYVNQPYIFELWSEEFDLFGCACL